MQETEARAEGGERDIQSVRRALDILEAVAAAGELGVTEIAHAVNLHVATTHNLLRTLARYQYLENRGGRYRIGAAVGVLAGQGDSLQGLPELLKPFMERISRETGEAASSSVLSGEVLRIIAFQPGTQAITIHFPQWIWPQPLCLATGRLLVSELPEEQWAGFITDGGQAVPGQTAQEWERDLRTIRSNGYCCIRHKDSGGQVAMAFPVRSRTGRLVVAIGASAPVFRATPELCGRMFDSIRQAAADLSAQFGYADDKLATIRSTRQPEWTGILQ